MPESDEEDPNSEATQAICDELDSDVNTQLLLSPYLNQARWISQSIHPYVSIQRVFYAGVPEAADEDEDADSDKATDDYTEDETLIFNAIMKLQRNFRAVVDAAATKTDRFLLLIKKISEASSASRADNTSKLKNAILDLIYEDPKKGSTFPLELQDERLVASDSKSLRGFQNIETAYHLCPLKFKAAFENDPRSFLDQIEDGSIICTAHDLPSFLYDQKTRYDERDEVTGLFRGFLLVRVYRHIFTGPSTSMNPTQNAPKSKAKMFNLKGVTGRTIAYACTYIALSTMPKWGYSHKQFRLDTFYDNIVSMFETSADDPWVKDTLSWWNMQVPGLRSKGKKGKKSQTPEADSGPSAADRIVAQLRARAKQQAPQQPLQDPRPRQKSPPPQDPRPHQYSPPPAPRSHQYSPPLASRSHHPPSPSRPHRQPPPSQAPRSCQQSSRPPSSPALSYREETPPGQVLAEDLESRQDPRHHKRRQEDDNEEEPRAQTGNLTSAVNWGNPHYLDNDEQVPRWKKRKRVVLSEEDSETEPESQDVEDHRMWEVKQRFREVEKRRKALERVLDDGHQSRKDAGSSHKQNGQNVGREYNDRQTHHNAPTKITMPKPKTHSTIQQAQREPLGPNSDTTNLDPDPPKSKKRRVSARKSQKSRKG